MGFFVGPHTGSRGDPDHKALHTRIGRLRLARAEMLDADPREYKNYAWSRTFGTISQHLRIADADHSLFHRRGE